MLRVRRRDDRRHLQAVPRQGDQGDPSPGARGRRSRRRGARSRSRPAIRSGRSSCSSTGRRPRSSRRASRSTAAPGTRSSARSSGCSVDPAEVFGTNCVKFAGADEDGLPRLARARAADRAAAARRRDGRGRARVPERASSSRSRSPLAATLGELQHFTPTIEALVVPDIDLSLDEQPAKTRFWNAFKPVGPWWAALPPY